VGKVHRYPDWEEMKRHIFSVSVTDEQTRNTIKSVYESYHVVLEQHGAVGWAGLEEYLKTAPDKKLAITLETAHPAKFPEEIQKLLGLSIPLPDSMKNIDQRKGSAVPINNDYNDFRNYLQKNLKIKE
jgi:threonine synthase